MKQELEPHHPSITTLSPIEDVMKKMVAHTATKQDYERISKEELANFRAALDLSKEEDQRTLDLWWRLVLKKKAVSFLTPLLEKLTQNDEISDPRDQRLLGHMYYKGLSVSEDKKKRSFGGLKLPKNKILKHFTNLSSTATNMKNLKYKTTKI